jgi:hypothetical protein
MITIAQLLLSGLAWYWLILNALPLLNSKKSRLLLLVLLIGLSSSAAIVQWDTVVLGTSLIISTVVMSVGQLLRVYHHPDSKVHFVLLIILLIMLSLEKLSHLPLAIGVAFSILLTVYRKLTRKFLASCLILMFVGFSYSTLVGINVDRNWQGSYSGTTLLWQLGNQSPTADSLKHYLESKGKAPQCIYEDAPYFNLNSSIGKILHECHDGSVYVRDELQRDFVSFAMFHPFQIAKLSALGFGAYYTNSSNNYGNAVQVYPSITNLVFFGATQPSLISGQIQDQSEGYSIVNSGKPFWLYVPGIGLLIAGLVASGFNLWITKDKFSESLLFSTPLLLLMQATVTTIFLPSEWVRQLVPYLAPVAALNIIAILILAERRNLFQKI